MIPAANRFHGHGSLRYVYANGKAIRTQLLTVKSIKNDRRKKSRLSVVVSKKILKGAVDRNRLRRRIYEIVRVNLPRFNDTYDVVIIVTHSGLAGLDHDELVDTIEKVLDQAGLYKQS